MTLSNHKRETDIFVAFLCGYIFFYAQASAQPTAKSNENIINTRFVEFSNSDADS